MAGNKFHNRKTSIYGREFDSRLESHRWIVLQNAERDGVITNLRTQVPYEVVPRQTEIHEVQLKTKVKTVERVVEMPVVYRADFVYEKDGKTVIEDTKSKITRTPEYVIKRKLMRLQGHPIREVEKPNETI